MKKISIIILFLFTIVATSQQQISFKIDGRNALFGSNVNKPALNYIISYTDTYNGWHNTRLGFFFEQFKEIEYIQFGAKLDHEFKLENYFLSNVAIINNTSILTGIEAGIVYRNASYADNAINYGANLEINYKIINNFKIALQLNYEICNDVSQFSRKSAYAGLIYEWE